MLQDKLQIYDLSLVFLGQFNPSIIQPLWLSSKNFIREHEGVEANVEIIHPEITRFTLGWSNFEVTKNRFLIRTSEEPYFEPVRDLALSIFSTLRETPVFALGINHIMHFGLPNEESHYKVGDILAPLSNWTSIITNPKLLNLEIVQQTRTDGIPGSIRIRVEPSDRLTSNRFSIALNINDHYALESKNLFGSKNILNYLSSNWKSSFEFARKATYQIGKLIE